MTVARRRASIVATSISIMSIIASNAPRASALPRASASLSTPELPDLEGNVLLGGLLALKEMSTKPDIIARWAAEGGKVFAAEARAKDTGREPLVIVFAGPIARELTAQLRASGLRWNKVL